MTPIWVGRRQRVNPILSSTTCLSSFFCGLAITSYMSMQIPRKFTPTNSTSGRMMKTTRTYTESIMRPSKVCRGVLWRIKQSSRLLRATMSLWASVPRCWEASYCFNPLAPEMDNHSLAHHLCTILIFYEPRRVTLGNTRHFVEE